MSSHKVQVSARIDNTPKAVIDYIADRRNSPMYLSSLKSVSDVKGDPSAVGTTWKWTWVMLGIEFEGHGRCIEHEPGKRYSFKTEGGIESTFTYEADPAETGTNLTVDVEFVLPDTLLSRVGIDSMIKAFRKAEADHATQNLKMILDR